MSNLNRFYVLEPGTGRTRVQHASRNDAEKEAARLVKLNPDRMFLVLRCVTEVTVLTPISFNRAESLA